MCHCTLLQCRTQAHGHVWAQGCPACPLLSTTLFREQPKMVQSSRDEHPPSHPCSPHCFVLSILPPTSPLHPKAPAATGSRASIQATLRTLLAAPWPSQRDIHSWLQLLSVLQWVLSFLLLGIVSLLLLIYLVFTSFWPISALYLAWIIFDWDTPEKGGRRLPCLRRWTVWRHFRDYFPVKLVKTHDLSPSHNYIIGSHPHGILCVGAFCNFITGSTGFGEMFPGIRPFLTTLAGNFRLPVFREYLMSGGLCPVTRRAIGYLLSKNGTGNAVAIVIGGAAESLSCRPGITTLTLKNRPTSSPPSPLGRMTSFARLSLKRAAG
ncbi:diacylglycerol O-acyltransferase 2-like isoform 3-T3 [Amazona ochrocephala]